MPNIRNLKLYLFIFSMPWIWCGDLACQSDTIVEYEYSRLKMFDLSFDMAFPLSTFKKKLNSEGVGFNISMMVQARLDGPVFWGINGNWHRYLTISDVFADYIDNELVDIKERTAVNIAGSEFVMRLYPNVNIPFLEPYIEGLVGVNFNFTTTTLNVIDTGENLDFYFEDTDFSLLYGLAGGFQVNLYNYTYYLNFKVAYLSGTSGRFYAERDDPPVSTRPIDQLEIKNAPIEVLRFQLGLTFAF